MTCVRIRDKRFEKGETCKFFRGDGWKQEVVDFVKSHKNAYFICGIGFALGREEYLKEAEKKLKEEMSK